MNSLVRKWHCATHALQKLDFIPLLALRLYLAPIMIISGWNKYQSFDNIVEWFGNPDWGLGLPLPALFAFLATAAELVGGWLLVFGLGTRLTSFVLMITMAVAAVTVHWQNGWFAIAPSDPSTSSATVLNWLNIPGSQASLENSAAVAQKLDMARSILQEHGNYSWLTDAGNYVILNNGIEFAATYFIMLLVLFIYGAGRYFSADYWINRSFIK